MYVLQVNETLHQQGEFYLIKLSYEPRSEKKKKNRWFTLLTVLRR